MKLSASAIFLTEQRDDLISTMDSLTQIIEDMDKNIKGTSKRASTGL